jgi:hypothetical protein
MAGSFNHLVDEDGTYHSDNVENMKDCGEALRDCWRIIYALAKGNSKKISKVCQEIGTVDPWSEEYGEARKKKMQPLKKDVW